MIDPEMINLSSEKAMEAILYYEREADELLAKGKIAEWEAWESYFALMFECNVRALNDKEYEERFYVIRKRLVDKIDRKKFNPFLSKNPAILIIARSIAARHNIPSNFDN